MSDRDIQPDVQTASLGLACRILACDESGAPMAPEALGTLIQQVNRLAAVLEAFAGAVVDQAVHAAILPALRAPCCCRHAEIERLRTQNRGLLDEVEDLRLELASARAQLAQIPCACGGSRPPEIRTVHLMTASEPCACKSSGVHSACVGHCPESAARSRQTSW